MRIEKIETGECRPCFDKSTRIAGAPGIRRTKPYWDSQQQFCWCESLDKSFLTENTAIIDEFVRSLKRDTDNMLYNHKRGSRDNSRNGERNRNNSMDRRSQIDSQDNTRRRYGNDTRETRNIHMPSRNRQDNRDDSRHRYGQRYNFRERRPEQQNISVRFESPRNDRGQNHQNINFNSPNAQKRSQSVPNRTT